MNIDMQGEGHYEGLEDQGNIQHLRDIKSKRGDNTPCHFDTKMMGTLMIM